MEIATDTGTLKHSASNTEIVKVRNICADRWEAWYDGKWRTVHIQVNRTYIKHRDLKITIEIWGV